MQIACCRGLRVKKQRESPQDVHGPLVHRKSPMLDVCAAPGARDDRPVEKRGKVCDVSVQPLLGRSFKALAWSILLVGGITSARAAEPDSPDAITGNAPNFGGELHESRQPDALLTVAPGLHAADPDPTALLRRDHGWPAGTIQEQLDADVTMVPFGKGALFVPAMANALDEPPLSVFKGGQKVDIVATTGKRIPLFPGKYDVRIGSGPLEQRFSVTTMVREQNVSVVPVTWSGLAIHMINERRRTVRGSYELIRVSDREYVGIGFGKDEDAGETVQTWILEAGVYKIVQVGQTYRARRDFATVRLEQGRFTDFLLVIDANTQNFIGSGEVPREELFIASKEQLAGSFVVGGAVSLNSRKNEPGILDGQVYAAQAFVDSSVTARIFESPLLLQLQIEEGFQLTLGEQAQPLRKTQDLVDISGLYVYRLVSWLGPYLRFDVQTNLFEARRFFETPTRIVVRREDGSLNDRGVVSDTSLSRPLGDTNIKEGIGLNVRAFKTLSAELSLRMGVGGRHQISRGLLGNPQTNTRFLVPTTTYERLRTNHLFGVESTVVAVGRLTRFVLLNLEFDTLAPFGNFEDLYFDLDATVAVKLTRFVSVNYVLRYRRNRAVLDRDFVSQDINLRFSIELP